MKQVKQVMKFGTIIFLLLGILFGALIMTFIFGNMGNIDILEDSIGTVSNESGAYVNSTGYTLAQSSVRGFSNPSITGAINATSGVVISLGNISVSSNGIVTNASTYQWDNVNISYTYNYYSDAEINSRDVNNQSLNALAQYSNQSDTQFLVVAISITLLILIGLFILFWKYFMTDTINKTMNTKANKFG